MNKARLEYEMKIRGITYTELGKVLGISRSALYKKCSGKSEFTRAEIEKIIEFLHLESPMGIFFNNRVS